MKRRVEHAYGRTVRGFMVVANPVKKKIINTQAITHKYININSVNILQNEGYFEAHNFYKKYINIMNEGVLWADLDFKSSNHFYHHQSGEGLYGFSNALDECKKYHKMAVRYMSEGYIKTSMYYLGAACHLVHDATVPMHVNKKLLGQHRNFELWIINKIEGGHSFTGKAGIISYPDVDEYIKNNAIFANDIMNKYSNIPNREERYMLVASSIIKAAEQSGAGFMLDFYNKYVK